MYICICIFKGSQLPGHARQLPGQPPRLAPPIPKPPQAWCHLGNQGNERGEAFESAKGIIGVIYSKTLVYMIFHNFLAERGHVFFTLSQNCSTPPSPPTPPSKQQLYDQKHAQTWGQDYLLTFRFRLTPLHPLPSPVSYLVQYFSDLVPKC